MTPHSQYAWQGDRYVPRPTECYLLTNYKHPDQTMNPPPATRPPPIGLGVGAGPRPHAHHEALNPHPTPLSSPSSHRKKSSTLSPTLLAPPSSSTTYLHIPFTSSSAQLAHLHPRAASAPTHSKVRWCPVSLALPHRRHATPRRPSLSRHAP